MFPEKWPHESGVAKSSARRGRLAQRPPLRRLGLYNAAAALPCGSVTAGELDGTLDCVHEVALVAAGQVVSSAFVSGRQRTPRLASRDRIRVVFDLELHHAGRSLALELECVPLLGLQAEPEHRRKTLELNRSALDLTGMQIRQN